MTHSDCQNSRLVIKPAFFFFLLRDGFFSIDLHAPPVFFVLFSVARGGKVLPQYPSQVLCTPPGTSGVTAYPILRHVHGQERAQEDTLHRHEVVRVCHLSCFSVRLCFFAVAT